MSEKENLSEEIPEDLFDIDDIGDFMPAEMSDIVPSVIPSGEPEIPEGMVGFNYDTSQGDIFADALKNLAEGGNKKPKNNSYLYPDVSLNGGKGIKLYNEQELQEAFEDFIHEGEEDNEEKDPCYIEINEDSVLFFSDWVYDAILNKTIQEMEENMKFSLAEFIEQGKRAFDRNISLNELDERTFRQIIKYFRNALYKSRHKKSSRYIRKFHTIFVNEFERLVYELIKDERFLSDPADD